MPQFSLKQHHLHPDLTVIEVNNSHAIARISLFGAQVLQYQPKKDQRERLFLSETAKLDGSKSIRGGIPVCWPWFGAHASDATIPAHGFVRTAQWHLTAMENDISETRLKLSPVDYPFKEWMAQATVELEIRIGASLSVTVETRNIGSRPLALSAALHTYFAVEDINQVTLTGLKGTYSDKTRNWAHFPSPQPYQFSEETDRIHLEAPAEVCIRENATLTPVSSTGHDSIVVWNPWDRCAVQFPDMPAGSYRKMLCVETALTRGFSLPAGEIHTLSQSIS